MQNIPDNEYNGHHLFYNFVVWSSSIQTFDARAGRKQTNKQNKHYGTII